MNLIKLSPRLPFSLDPFTDLDSWTDQLFNLVRGGDNQFRMPATDIQETDQAYEVTAELPGVKKEDIRVSLDRGMLTIEAESRQEEKQEDSGRVLRSERRYGKYMRRFALGPGVNDDNVSARFEDGVLHLTIPKQEEAQEKKAIPIQ